MATKSASKASSKDKARASGAAKPAKTKDPFSSVDKLLVGEATKARTEEAVALLDEFLADEPEDIDALVRLTRAWVRQLEAETGTVLVEKPQFQRALDTYGRKALAAAEKAYGLDDESSDTIGWNLIAYGYHSVAVGIVRAFLSGAASKYIELADKLIAADASWHSGAGDRAMGRYYREAPWPKRDLKKSVAHFRKAIGHAPKRLENKLQLALALIDSGEKAEAKKLLEEVLKGKPEATEAHFHSFVVDFAREKLGSL